MFSNSKFVMFADDLKIFKLISSESDALGLQSDLRKVEDWCRRNNLRINAHKCHVIEEVQHIWNTVGNLEYRSI